MRKLALVFLLLAPLAWGAPSVVQTCTNSVYSVTSGTCTFASAVASGDVIVLISDAVAATNSTPSASGCSLTWTTIDLDSGTTSGYSGFGVFMATSAGGCTTVTITQSVSGSYRLNFLGYDLSGVKTTLDGHQHAVTTSSPNPFVTPSITTTVNGDLVISVFAQTNDNQSTPSTVASPFTRDVSFTCCGNAYWGGAAHDIQATAGAISGSWTAGFSSPVWLETFALEATGGGGGGSHPPCTLTTLGAGVC